MENIQDDPYCEGNGDPHDEVVRLEALIEELTAKMESCRKFILASRFVTWGGGVILFAMLLGAMRFDLGIMAAAVAALLGGFVVWGSNSSTAKETAKELAQAEADRIALITIINPRAVPSGQVTRANEGRRKIGNCGPRRRGLFGRSRRGHRSRPSTHGQLHVWQAKNGSASVHPVSGRQAACAAALEERAGARLAVRVHERARWA